MKRHLVLGLGLGLTVLWSGCGSSDSSSPSPGGQGGGGQPDAGDDAGGTGGTATDAGADADLPDVEVDAEPDTSPPPDAQPDVGPPCNSAEPVCISHATRRVCKAGHWEEEACAPGSGCLRGECVASACSDECTLGSSNGGKTCELFDMATASWVTPDTASSMHDRARAYEQWLHRDGMAYGGVGNARYADPGTYSQVVSLGGLGDSAIWTGTYLAAEALRLRATGSAVARANVIDAVQTLHLWFNVSGDPGLLARFAAPSGPHPVQLTDLDCASPRTHCNVPYQGQPYDYIGQVSRDQYQGVMLGYALAYEALGEGDEATRALIREDVVELVQELMKERTVQVRLTWNGVSSPPADVTMQFVVLATREMSNGVVDLRIDSSDYASSEMLGFQEFMPDLAHVVRQIPLMGWVPGIPRADSAIMLASFFKVGALVTDGVAGWESQHDEMVNFYDANASSGGNINDWLPIMSQWDYANACGEAYYGINISMEPMYNLARLETDAVLGGLIRTNVLQNRLWQDIQNTKNSFFSFIYASNYANAAGNVVPDAAAQLAGFPPPPRIRTAVDWRNDPKYQPHEPGCTDQVAHTTAVDVADRVVDDFIWQRHPWGLYDAGDPAQTFPGVDYLVAYWMGRHHAYLPEDKPNVCAVWR